MNPKLNRRLLMIIAIIVIVFLSAIVWWYLSRPTENNTNNTSATNTNKTTVNSVVNVASAVTNINAASSAELALVRMANIFAERLGSYSSDAEFQNLLDLKGYMTAKMQTWADSYIKAQTAASASPSFSSVTTKVLSTKVNSLAETKAQVRLITQRTETGTNINGNKTYNQDLILDLVQTDGSWLADKATWQ